MSAENKKLLVVALVALMVGLALGIFYGWVIDPVEWVNASPEYLRSDLQVDYLRMAMDSFRVNPDAALAATRYSLLGSGGPAALEAVSQTADPAVLAGFMQAISGLPAPTPEGTTGGSSGTLLGTVVIVVGVIAILGVLGAALFYLFRTRTSSSGPVEKSAAAQAIEANKTFQKTDYTQQGTAPPVAQFVTTYVRGDDLFDDSFSVDSPSGEFLGECGVGISKTIGVGEPKNVTAFEVWIFDKNDIQTVTKVLMSPHAFRDAGLQKELESKGDLEEMVSGRQVVLETQTLFLYATVVDAQYGQGPLPPESYLERLTLELAIWQKPAQG